MPLPVRYVEPKKVCSSPLLTEEETRAGDALAAVTVRSLAGLIRQLSSLALHAEGVMGELVDSLAGCHARTSSLEKRVSVLKTDILPNLDPDREVLEGFEIPHPDHQFKSDKTIDQRLLTQQHAPAGLIEQYDSADQPPDLDQFSVEWGDGTNAMHLYSCPTFFFESWRYEIQKETMRKMSLFSPVSEGGGKKKSKRGLVHSTGSDKVSSYVRPGKRSFKLSGRPHTKRNSFHGSTQSLHEIDFTSSPSSSLGQRRSPSFRSIHARTVSVGQMQSQSVCSKPKKRPKLHSLNKATSALYEGQIIELVAPATTLEDSDKHNTSNSKQTKQKMSFRRSPSFRKSRSRSPVPPPIPTSSIFTDMPMYTLDKELTRQESSKLATLSKHHLLCLDLGSSSFETCLAVDAKRKLNSTFRPPAGMKLRPISSLDVQLVSKRGDGTQHGRQGLRRYRSGGAIELRVSVDNVFDGAATIDSSQKKEVLKVQGNPSLPRTRPVSASFVDLPMVQLFKTSSRTSLRSHEGSLTDFTRMVAEVRRDSPVARTPSPLPSKFKPRRPAPLAPPLRKAGRQEASDSNPSTPHDSSNQSPLFQRSLSISSASSNDTVLSVIPNGRVTPNNPANKDRREVQSPMQQIAGSPQLPMNPIQEEDGDPQGGLSAPNFIPDVRISSPVSPKPIPQLVKQESLYISRRKQSLTADTVERNTSRSFLRASQILATAGIYSGDMSSSRMDLLKAIRKGIQLQKVMKEEKKKETMDVNMPWDVAAILERRFALELYSDSESSSNGSNNEEWDD